MTRMILDCGMSVLDAATGKILFHCGSPADAGRGMMANVGAGGHYQIWGDFEEENGGRIPLPPRKKTDSGFEPAEIPGLTSNFRIFWDGRPYDDLLDGEPGGELEIRAFNGERMETIFRTEGCVSIHGSKAVPCLQADLLGDWREELIMARKDQEALRVFVSNIPTEYSLMTLMHDPLYRSGVAAEQTGYNQPPHIDFCLRAAGDAGDGSQ